MYYTHMELKIFVSHNLSKNCTSSAIIRKILTVSFIYLYFTKFFILWLVILYIEYASYCQWHIFINVYVFFNSMKKCLDHTSTPKMLIYNINVLA